jgi:hypothetical protein
MRKRDVHVPCGSDHRMIGTPHDGERQTRAALLFGECLRNIVVHVRQSLDCARLQSPEISLEPDVRERRHVLDPERLEGDDRSVKRERHERHSRISPRQQSPLKSDGPCTAARTQDRTRAHPPVAPRS